MMFSRDNCRTKALTAPEFAREPVIIYGAKLGGVHCRKYARFCFISAVSDSVSKMKSVTSGSDGLPVTSDAAAIFP